MPSQNFCNKITFYCELCAARPSFECQSAFWPLWRIICLLRDSNVAKLSRVKSDSGNDKYPRTSFPLAVNPGYELMISTPGDHQYEAAGYFSSELKQFYPPMFCLYKAAVLVAYCGFRAASDEILSTTLINQSRNA